MAIMFSLVIPKAGQCKKYKATSALNPELLSEVHSVAGLERQGLALDGFWPVTVHIFV